MFSSPTPLLEIVAAQKRGQARGIPSLCSAHPAVLRTAMEHAKSSDSTVLVEATCNQVNQFGGYTGLTPQAFADYLAGIAGECGFPSQHILLGGDHLGPNPWRKEPALAALEKARTLVADFVRAGFSKIHLDASMGCADDGVLPPAEIARRAAELCAAAEAAVEPGQPAPLYVVGTEVPPPGGAREGEVLQVTRPQDALETLSVFHAAFRARGLDGAWERVIALVVQPGVEYGDNSVHAYDHQRAAPLSRAIENQPGIVYEAHSTDYQAPAALRELVEDHFAVLKVGPQLTYAYREALFALARIEEEWLGGGAGVRLSGLVEALITTLQADPSDWAAYYHGSPAEIEFAMKYSLSDRVRYYWLREPLRGAVERLMENLNQQPIPLTLLSQYLPEECRRVRERQLQNDPQALARAHVQWVLEDYAAACE